LLLVDTNVWLAAADRSSRDHVACVEVLRQRAGELASTVPVIAETAWLLLDRGGAQAQLRFLATVASNQVTVVDLATPDWQRIVELVEVYADLRLDVVDASTMAAAERLSLTTIATLDQRDFRTVRPMHVDAFRLVPGQS
jgi:predicted nucleic acid-binding protein